ncbi:MAG TPA: type II secretion system protein GspG [Candidatus Polarisedimenticolaceae bacterium]|nr:type II secretion system protein GspG [Candidatus Polarisedimenticolaceae bacterium]
MIVSCIALSLSLGGCNKAERLYAEAHEHIERSEFAQAVALYDEIISTYPDSETAARASREVELYRGLATAVDFYPERRIYDQMIETARAIYKYENRRGRWPESLDRLTPDYLERPPIDPWGRELLYGVKPQRRGYVLGCYGADGRLGGDGAARDWFIEDGDFVRKPSKALS